MTEKGNQLILRYEQVDALGMVHQCWVHDKRSLAHSETNDAPPNLLASLGCISSFLYDGYILIVEFLYLHGVPKAALARKPIIDPHIDLLIGDEAFPEIGHEPGVMVHLLNADIPGQKTLVDWH